MRPKAAVDARRLPFFQTHARESNGASACARAVRSMRGTRRSDAAGSNHGAKRDECDGRDGEPIPEHHALQQLEMPAEHVDTPARSAPNPCHWEGDDFSHENKRYIRKSEVTIEGHSDDDLVTRKVYILPWFTRPMRKPGRANVKLS